MSGAPTAKWLAPQCYLSTKNNDLGDEITPYVKSGKVSLDANNDVPMSLDMDLNREGIVPGFTWIAPFLSITYYDRELEADVVVREQVGLFLVMPPGESHTAGSGTVNLTGYDPTWILQQSILPDGYTAQKGKNVVKAMREIVAGANFDRVNIPSKSNTFRKRRSYDPGTSRLEVLNDMAMRIGYYPLETDGQGVISSGYIRTLIKEHPARTISTANGDVVDTVTLEQDAERLCNRVVVFKADTNEDDDEDTRILAVMENRRAKSPVSIDNLGIVLGKKIEGSNIDTAAEAKALARKTLEEGASVLTRLSVSTLPDPRFRARDVIRAEISRDDGTVVADGNFWVDQVTIGFTPNDGAMTWRLNRLEEWEEEN
jgi:hypothetical protein